MHAGVVDEVVAGIGAATGTVGLVVGIVVAVEVLMFSHSSFVYLFSNQMNLSIYLTLCLFS